MLLLHVVIQFLGHDIIHGITGMSNSDISFLNFRYYSNAISETNRPSYTPVFISNPAEYHKQLNSKEYQIFVIDDIFGEACLNLSRVEQWRPHLEDIMVDVTANRPKTLVIVCVNKVCLIVLKKTGNLSFIWTAKLNRYTVRGSNSFSFFLSFLFLPSREEITIIFFCKIGVKL